MSANVTAVDSYEFDFVSALRPSRRKKVLQKAAFDELLHEMGVVELSEMAAMHADEVTELQRIAE